MKFTCVVHKGEVFLLKRLFSEEKGGKYFFSSHGKQSLPPIRVEILISDILYSVDHRSIGGILKKDL